MKKINFKKLVIIFLIILGIILVFTLVDYITHSLSEEYAVPGYYYRNKVIFGTLIGLITYILIRKLKWYYKAVIFSAVVSTLLQARYYIEGYAKDFVLLFLGLHFLMLIVISLIVFRAGKKYL